MSVDQEKRYGYQEDGSFIDRPMTPEEREAYLKYGPGWLGGGPQTPVETGQKLMGLVELAQYLDVSEDTVRRLTRQGKIPFQRVGRQYRYSLPEVQQAWASSERVESEYRKAWKKYLQISQEKNPWSFFKVSLGIRDAHLITENNLLAVKDGDYLLINAETGHLQVMPEAAIPVEDRIQVASSVELGAMQEALAEEVERSRLKNLTVLREEIDQEVAGKEVLTPKGVFDEATLAKIDELMTAWNQRNDEQYRIAEMIAAGSKGLL